MLCLKAVTERFSLKYMFLKNRQNRDMKKDVDTLQCQRRLTSSS